MDTIINSDLSRLRLLHLVSPSLPIGAFTYSQGLEWAVECGWVEDETSLQNWILDLLQTNMRLLDVPVLIRLYKASRDSDDEALAYWSHYLLASRETSELRSEERQRGRAMAALLPDLGINVSMNNLQAVKQCQLTGFAQASYQWQIPLPQMLAGYLWSWLENIVLAGVKIVPLGQRAGQRIITALTAVIPEIVAAGSEIDDDLIGASCCAQAIASCRHETQYTRIYRS